MCWTLPHAIKTKIT